MNQVVRLFFISFIAFLSWQPASGQTLSESGTVHSSSDMWVWFNWGAIEGNLGCDGCPGTCACTTSKSFLFYSDPDADIVGPGNEELGEIGGQPETGNLNGGSYTYAAGPRTERYYYFRYKHTKTIDDGFCSSCSESTFSDVFYVETLNTQPPHNVEVTGLNFTDIEVTWERSLTTDIPESQLRYAIYKDGEYLLSTSEPGVFSWIDTGNSPGELHTYTIKARYIHWTAYSGPATGTGSSLALLLDATDGDYSSKTKISWPNISDFADEIRVYREKLTLPDTSKEEIAIVSGNATVHNDYDGIPGVEYMYSIEPVGPNGEAYPGYSDLGHRRENGRISGEVTTPFNAGVSGVEVTVTNLAGTEYSATTDASGYYNIPEIFYYEEMEMEIVPAQSGHGFNPASATRTLDLLSPVISNVNFTDTTVFSVLGQAYFAGPSGGDTCWVMGADILLDGNVTGVTTDMHGEYSIGVQELGIHTISIDYEDHDFTPSSHTLDITDNYFNQNFINTTTDTVVVKVKGGCGNIIADYARFTVSSTDDGNCYSEEFTTNASGVSTLVLPAREYEINVIELYVQDENQQDIVDYFDPIVVDLTARDSIVSPADSTQMVDVVTYADFIYHSNIEIIVNNLDPMVCGPDGDLNLMAQGEQVLIEIAVMETHDYPTAESCPVDTGTVTITDEISDDQAAVTADLVNGTAYYMITPGVPNILDGGAHPYQKKLQITANVGFSDPVDEIIWALVEGHKPREETFATKTPELPFFVLHDPPGDLSYAYLSEDSTYTYAYSNSYQYGGGAGAFLDMKMGVSLAVPFTGLVIGGGVHLEASAIAGRNNADNDALVTTFSVTEEFTTSPEEAIIGAPGDVFVGGSFNMIYALTDVISYEACSIVVDTTLAWGANDLATTYMYTEQHISGTLIPQLELLKDMANGDSVELFQGYINVWEQVLAKNETNKEEAIQVENISFSAGANYESSTTTATDTSYGIEYDIYLDLEFSAAVIFGDGNYNENELGVKAQFNWNTGYADETTIGTSKTVGYHLEDDDAGDFFSIDVKKDRVYGTPVFSLAAGTSSCPYEPGSIPRDVPSITVDSNSVVNVPPNEAAVFTVNLGNASESGETREYSVRSLNEANLDGAIVRLGGQLISGGAINYTIPPGQSIPALLTVERGPLVNTYDNLAVFIYPPCEAVGSAIATWNLRQADTVYFSAHFQNECSNVELYTPVDNWLANTTDSNDVQITFTGFNMNDPNLVDVRVQYRRTGQAWETIGSSITESTELTQQYYFYNWDISGIPDGSYELRAMANCGAQNGGVNYSPIKSGVIDRTSISLFGVPTPSDGVLNVDEIISVTFNEPIDCDLLYDPVEITLIQTITGDTVPITFSCYENTIIIQTDPVSLLETLENVELTASVSNLSDFNGNALEAAAEWSFSVNRSQVYWNPSNVVASSVIGETANFTSELKNVSGASEDYTLTQVPAWLVPSQMTGSVPSGGVIPIDFEIGVNLDLGIYEDTVIATINGNEQYLFINLQVNSLAPDWSVNPADFDYNMSFTGQFSITDLDAPLSEDRRDMIAAFVGEECRGVANIVYVPNQNMYAAFVTVYSNVAFGDSLKFRFWDSYPGTEYQAEETLAFIPDQVLGQPLAPYILHPGGVFQTVNLNTGWNWFSLNVLSDDMTVDSVLSTVVANNGDVVKTQTGSSQYNDVTGWWSGEDGFSEFDNDHSYLIQVSEASSLRFLGQPLPDDYEIQVAAGWTWLGYPRLAINPVADILDSYVATQDDIIKTNSEFASYDATADDWIGSMTAFKPSRGYKLRTVNPGGIQFIGAPPTQPVEECENSELFENNMTIAAKLTNNGNDIFDSHFIVTASINDSCRAWAQPEYIPELNAYRMLFTIPGYLTNTGQEISFEVIDNDNGSIFTPEYTSVSFNTNDVVGDLVDAFVLNINTVGVEEMLNVQGHWLGQNVPNPFNDQTLIPYSLGESTNVQLEVYDMIGNRVMQLVSQNQSAGKYQVSFNRDALAGGMYMYVLSTDQGRQTKRMILTD